MDKICVKDLYGGLIFVAKDNWEWIADNTCWFSCNNIGKIVEIHTIPPNEIRKIYLDFCVERDYYKCHSSDYDHYSRYNVLNKLCDRFENAYKNIGYDIKNNKVIDS